MFNLEYNRLNLVLILTADHECQRLQWCNERIHYDQQWISMVFSDESNF
jgi:hypothetical protein